MKFILHRRNKIREIKSSPSKYGLEIDIRSYGKNLVLNHDPFKKGELLKDWIKHYHHGTLILNVKEEGLEEEIKLILDDSKIIDYFFLDQSFPFLIKWAKRGENNCAVRFSEFESLETVISLSGKISWVWVDCFSKYIITKEIADKLKNNDFNICLVSPELQGRDGYSEIPLVAKNIKDADIHIDAVCTKMPETWEQSLAND
mgnify:CR=1 FL=1